MSPTEILATIQSLLAEHRGIERTLQPSMRLVGDLQLDSLDQLTLVAEIENRFRFCFEPEAEAQIETVGDLVRLIGEQVGR